MEDKLETTDKNLEQERTEQPIQSDNQYPIETEQESGPRRSWPMLVALIVAALMFALLVVLAGRFAYHKLHHTVTPAPAQTKDLPKAPPGTVKSSGSSSASSSSQSTSKQLADTGPGDTLAIFATASFAAASLHYIVSLRKQSQS